jgi:uncharacterized protein YbcI
MKKGTLVIDEGTKLVQVTGGSFQDIVLNVDGVTKQTEVVSVFVFVEQVNKNLQIDSND